METSLRTGKSLNVCVDVGLNSLELVVDFRRKNPSPPPPLHIQRFRKSSEPSQHHPAGPEMEHEHTHHHRWRKVKVHLFNWNVEECQLMWVYLYFLSHKNFTCHRNSNIVHWEIIPSFRNKTFESQSPWKPQNPSFNRNNMVSWPTRHKNKRQRSLESFHWRPLLHYYCVFVLLSLLLWQRRRPWQRLYFLQQL